MLQGSVLGLGLLLLLGVSGSATKFNLLSRKRNPIPQEGDVRLFGGGVSDGRVEIYHIGKWGTVCDDGWDMAEAQVVCRQLRFPGAKSVVTGKDYGKASGPIWLDNVVCKGTENHLSTCTFTKWGVNDCSHKEDVGVMCEISGSNVTEINTPHELDHSISLSDELGRVFDSGRGCDFLISVQSDTGDELEDGTPEVAETTICAHKLILSQFPLFNASEGTVGITVNVSQSCQPHFTSFIRYIYTRKVDVTFSSAQCLHWMAYMFGVEQLKEDAGRLFSQILPEDALFHTPLSLYEYAVETADLVLQETCIQYLAWNYQNLTRSPAWTHLSANVLRSLLMRSDLVVPDEYFLLQTVENWIAEKGNSTSLETQADLLSGIRFPMIPAEALYSLESNSSLYNTHKVMYRENMLKAFQFNVLLLSNLMTSPTFDRQDDDYHPRIYTAAPWSVSITTVDTDYASYNYNYNYNYNQVTSRYLDTPVHNSLVFKSKMIRWEANLFKNQQQCSNRGMRCESFPTARLATQNNLGAWSNILFRNRLLLMCHDKYIFQVQEFKNNLAVNGTEEYPCPDEKLSYRFVVRPEYI